MLFEFQDYIQNLIKAYGASHRFNRQTLLIWLQDQWYSLHESLKYKQNCQ